MSEHEDVFGLLSGRERSIVQQAAYGGTYAEIAEVMYLSVGTIKWHMSKVYAKLEVANRYQLVALYWQTQLADALAANRQSE